MPSVPEPIRRQCPLAVGPVTQEPETPEGTSILIEVPGTTGALLWGALRDVLLWIEASPGSRGRRFGPDAKGIRTAWIRSHPVPEDLASPLLTLAEMTGAAEAATPERVVRACAQIAGWAARTGAVETRLAFSEAAALLAPEDPRLALAAGRLARDLGRPDRAETWLRRAIDRAPSPW